jgi:Glycosyl transferase family 2
MAGSAVSESNFIPPDPETLLLISPRDLPDQRSTGEDVARSARPQNGHRSAGRSSTQLSVVIPTWNEAANLEHVLPQLGRFDEVIVVDGMSSDGTHDVVRRLRPDATLLERPPRGKGDALRAGFEAATLDVIVMMDADGSMDLREIDAFVALIDLGYDLVKGSRVICGGGSHDLTMIRSLGNKALCWLGNQLFRTSWTDLCYGFIVMRRSCIPQLALTGTGFEIETEILARAALANLRMAELPSIEMPRLYGDSHLNARRDGIRVLRTMLGAWCTPRARRVASNLRPLIR